MSASSLKLSRTTGLACGFTLQEKSGRKSRISYVTRGLSRHLMRQPLFIEIRLQKAGLQQNPQKVSRATCRLSLKAYFSRFPRLLLSFLKPP